MKVFEYFLNQNDYIMGWQEHNSKNRPEYIDYQKPLQEMNNVGVDSLLRVWSGTHIFKLIGFVIISELYNEAPAIDRITQLEIRVTALEDSQGL